LLKPKVGSKVEVAVVTGLLAKRDMYVDSGHNELPKAVCCISAGAVLLDKVTAVVHVYKEKVKDGIALRQLMQYKADTEYSGNNLRMLWEQFCSALLALLRRWLPWVISLRSISR
jgi:hypothetical protein